MNDYKILIELLEKYKEEATRIFNKLKEVNQEARTGILQYGRYSVFGRIEWDCFNENYITVRYYDDECPVSSPTHEWAIVKGNIHDNPDMIENN